MRGGGSTAVMVTVRVNGIGGTFVLLSRQLRFVMARRGWEGEKKGQRVRVRVREIGGTLVLLSRPVLDVMGQDCQRRLTE